MCLLSVSNYIRRVFNELESIGVTANKFGEVPIYKLFVAACYKYNGDYQYVLHAPYRATKYNAGVFTAVSNAPHPYSASVDAYKVSDIDYGVHSYFCNTPDNIRFPIVIDTKYKNSRFEYGNYFWPPDGDEEAFYATVKYTLVMLKCYVKPRWLIGAGANTDLATSKKLFKFGIHILFHTVFSRIIVPESQMTKAFKLLKG